MAWQENLFNNLLVAGILFGMVVIIYCKVTKKSLRDLMAEIRDIQEDGYQT